MKRISILIVTLLFLSGCIKEESSCCNLGLHLRFRYTLNDQYTNLFGAEVNRIAVYVFDSKGKYVDTFSEQGDKLTNDYVMNVSVPKGRYSVVAYGGDFSTYSAGELTAQTNAINHLLRKGVTDIHDFRVELKNIIEQDNYLHPTQIPDDLYVGLVHDVLSCPSNKKITDVELIKDTKKIKVKITGIDNINAPLDVYIIARNGRYTFDNSIDMNHGIFKYTSVKSLQQTNYLEVDLKMMRLVLGQSPMLVVKNSLTSEVIYSKNMIEQILLTKKYTTQADFDREDEFVFDLTIKSTNNKVTISVSINGWKIIMVNPDIS